RLEKALAGYTTELDAQQRAIREYVEAIGAGDPVVIAVKQRAAEERLSMTQKQLVDIEAQIRRMKVELKAAEGAGGGPGPEVAESALGPAIKAHPDYRKAAERHDQIAADVAKYRASLAPGAATPATLQAIEADLAAAQKDLEVVTARVRGELTATA